MTRLPRVRVLVSGMIARDAHQGGATWAVLQYLLGLQRLGCDVYFVEPVPCSSLKPEGVSLAESSNATYFRQVIEQFKFAGRAALLLSDTQATVGLAYRELVEIAGKTDVLLNVSGMLTDPALLEKIRVRVYLDLDPVFNQLWHVAANIDMRFDGHTHFVTVGQSLGCDGCPVPTAGRSWIPTGPPGVLDAWPGSRKIRYDAFTTVANWRGYGSIDYDGVTYGQKAHALREFMMLPRMTRENFTLALSIHPEEVKDLDALDRYGWRLTDPCVVAGTPESYRQFVAESKAELGIAKAGYVRARSGWFSDRSACYLASGRPVVALDTGFSRHLPTGEGLFAFTTYEQALAGIGAIRANYTRHSAAARAVAEQCFDSNKVLPHLLERVDVGVAV